MVVAPSNCVFYFDCVLHVLIDAKKYLFWRPFWKCKFSLMLILELKRKLNLIYIINPHILSLIYSIKVVTLNVQNNI